MNLNGYEAISHVKNGYTVYLSSHSVQRGEERYVSLDVASALANDMGGKGIFNFLPHGTKFCVRIKQEAVIENGRLVSESFDNTYIFGIGYDMENSQPSLNLCTVWNNCDRTFFFKEEILVMDAKFENDSFVFAMADMDTISFFENEIEVA